MVFYLHFGFTILFKEWLKEKKIILFWGKKQEKQNRANIMIAFLMKLKLQWE